MDKTTKKIALVYSGQPRNIKECHDNHVSTFYTENKECEIDVFAHFWYSDSLIGNYFWNSYPNRGYYEPDIKKTIVNLLKPVDALYEPPLEFITDIQPDKRFPHPVSNTLSMFYSIEKANNLKTAYELKHNFKYDCVVRLRTDEYFINPVGNLFDYDMSSINLLNETPHMPYGVNDHFAFGRSDIMNKYSSVFSNLDTIVKDGCAINPECLLGYNLLLKKIPIIKHSNWTFKLFRDLY